MIKLLAYLEPPRASYPLARLWPRLWPRFWPRRKSNKKKVKTKKENIYTFFFASLYYFDCTFNFNCLTQESFKLRLEECEERNHDE